MISTNQTSFFMTFVQLSDDDVTLFTVKMFIQGNMHGDDDLKEDNLLSLNFYFILQIHHCNCFITF